MAILPLLTAPDPRLSRKALPVEKVGPEEKKIIADMLETMYAADGLGLAAPQVNIPKRIIVMDMADKRNGEKPAPLVLVNPVIIWTSEEESAVEEGCLSVPNYWTQIPRSAAIEVEYLDENGHHQKLNAQGLLAICIQHEIDHLEGILFIDHLSSLKRSMALKKSQKNR